MKRLMFCLLILVANLSFAADMLPINVVNTRMQAHNNHDMDAFLSVYADDVKILEYPDRQVNAGKDNLRSIFEDRFRNDVHVQIHYQMAIDSFVINEETVTVGDQVTKYISIYEVRDGLIRSVNFVRD